MNATKNIYVQCLSLLEQPGSPRNDWRWLLGWCLMCYGIVLTFRLSFTGRWNHEELWVNGERLLATHDAYFWLAKAKGAGNLEGFPFAAWTQFFHNATGIGLGDIGFFGPAVLASLVGVVCAVWGWMLGGRSAAIFAGLLGSLTPGFYFRTRLGYFDTDLFTLLAPLLIAAMLARICQRCLNDGWFNARPHQSDEILPTSFYLEAFVFGLISRACGVWHFDIVNLSIGYLLLAIVVMVVNAAPEKRGRGLCALAVYALAALPGAEYAGSVAGWLELIGDPTVVGISTAVALVGGIFFTERKNASVLDNAWIGFGVVAAVVCALLFSPYMFAKVANKIAIYYAPEHESATSVLKHSDTLSFPGVVQSIIEAKQTSFSNVLFRGAIYVWLGWLAIACSLAVIALRPIAVFLAPLIVFHLSSVFIGVRFTMFGGAALIIVTGVVLSWCGAALSRRLNFKPMVNQGFQFAIAAAVLAHSYTVYEKLPLTPVLKKQHAEALIELGSDASEDSVVWTWWDWGYATQYYAGLQTVADGGHHASRVIYPLAFAFSSETPALAAGMVRYAAEHPSQQRRDGTFIVARQWDDVPSFEINQVIDRQLRRTDFNAASPQYIVVTWKDLSLAKWITHFGNWNLADGTTRAAKIRNFKPGELGFNLQLGAMKTRNGQSGLLNTITALDEGKVEKHEYFMNSFSRQLLPELNHLFINTVTRESILSDRVGQRSTMARLLTGDPQSPELSQHFRLVLEKLPFVRIYEVIQ